MSKPSSNCSEEHFKDFFRLFGFSTKRLRIYVKKYMAGYSKRSFMCPDDFFGKSWWKTHSSTFFGIEDTLLWYMARVFQQECINCTLCPRERSDEKFFLETFVFLPFSEKVWIFSRFSGNFLARLSMLQESCLEEQFEDKFCSEKGFIHQFEMLSGILFRHAVIFFCKSVKTAFYVSKGIFRGNLLWKIFFKQFRTLSEV